MSDPTSKLADGARAALPWPGRPSAPAPLVAALRELARGGRSRWIDPAGASGPCGVAFFARELPRWLWFRILVTIARVGAVALGGGSPPASIGAKRPGGGPLVLVLPVLPDLSHTFVYREVLALRERIPDSVVVCLERGGSAPRHPEAERLARDLAYLPMRGITSRYSLVLNWMLRAPRRVRRLLALYGPRRFGLLGKGPLRDARHPGRGFELARALRELRPGHLHCYGSTYAANVTMEAACLLDVPFSLSSYVDFEFDYDFKLLPEKARLARFFRVCTRYCQQRMSALLPGIDPARVPVIVWGLDLDNWRTPAVPAGEGRLFSAARLVEKKGLHLVPAALAILSARGVKARWRLAGDGPEMPRLVARIAELGLAGQVDLLGPLSNDRVREELSRADAALLPCVLGADGERDGIPIFLTEAMALGVPVVTTSVSGIPELVRHGESGLLARPGDEADLAVQLEALLTDGTLRRKLGEAGRAEVFRTQDVRASAAELERLLAAEAGQDPSK